MIEACPQCGSSNIRFAHMRTPAERAAIVFGVRPLRCRDCRARFKARVWKLSEAAYARCSRCWRTDLASWSPSQYRVSFFKSLLLFLGANPYRCEYCRHNFVTFRIRKQRYVSAKTRSLQDEGPEEAERSGSTSG